jgi:hypothetical protein
MSKSQSLPSAVEENHNFFANGVSSACEAGHDQDGSSAAGTQPLYSISLDGPDVKMYKREPQNRCVIILNRV